MDEVLLADPLTEREVDIIDCIADGLTNREIAHHLVLSPETVKWYNKQIFSKLGVHNRTQAVARARSLGLMGGGPTAPFNVHDLRLPRNNLPVQFTSFVGRKREIIEVKNLLDDERLLTITGPAGSGKTRLALRVAFELLPQFKDGVFFMPFASVADPDNVLWAIAEQVGYQFQPHADPLNQLLKYFREKTFLLILDNFEHLLKGAGILATILSSAPNIKLLVTSRERLNLYGEASYVIGGLELPDEDNPYSPVPAESVELFRKRARSINPGLVLTPHDWQQISRICRLVDGLPLGIELAATWVDVLSSTEIADEIDRSLDILETELRGGTYSQNSMRAAFDRSWDLLNEKQQAAFRRLSVFRRDFTRQAASKVAEVDLKTLHALVNKSLLSYSPSTSRFEIHELLRQYAAEKLESSGETDSLAEAFAIYFADFMKERWDRMKGLKQRTALLEIESDIENARAAWLYWIRQRNVARLTHFFHGFWVIYDIRGWYPAGVELFERAVLMMSTLRTSESEAALAWLLAAQGLYNVAGGVHTSVGGSRRGFMLAQQAVNMMARLDGYDELRIMPLLSLFVTASNVNERDIAFEAAQQCLAVASRTSDDWATARAKQFLTVKAVNEGDFELAERLAHEALVTYEASGDNWSKSVHCVEVLGLVAISQRQYDKAKEWIERGLAAAKEIGFEYSQQMAYWQLGYLAILQDNYAEAAKNWHKAMEVGENVLGSPTIIGFGGSGNTLEWGGRELIVD